MDKKQAINAIKCTVMAAIVLVAAFLGCFIGLIIFTIKGNVPVDLSIILISSVISYLVFIIGMAYGIHKKIYICSVLLLVTGIISFIYLLFCKGAKVGFFTIIISMFFLCCFYQGVRGTRYFKNIIDNE